MINRRFGSLINLLNFVACHYRSIDQNLLEAPNGAFLFPFIDFLICTVEIAIALGMSTPAVRQAVNQRRTLSGAGVLVSSQHRFIDCQHIIAVHGHTGDAVTGSAIGNIFDVH